jgi:hypothetical protein
VDAIATPFVQGHLRGQALKVLIETTCAHCGEAISLEVSHDMQARVLTPDAQPVIFLPPVDFKHLADPSIIDAF